jgi:CRP-like cAMP-binding protein
VITIVQPSKTYSMTQPVIELIQAHIPDSEPVLYELESNTVRKEFSPGRVVLEEGDICRYIFFLETGSFRSYVVRKDKEINIWFMLEGDMASAPKSFIYQEPAKEYIEAMEKTVATCITREALESIGRKFPDFQTMVLKLLWKYHTMFYDRLLELLHKTPEERLQYLIKNHPEIWNRVPKKYLSSYLGMSVATWTRSSQP